MEWKKTFNHGQWAVHGMFLITVLATLGLALYSLRILQLQSTEEERIEKVKTLILEIRTDDPFEKVGKSLLRAEADNADEKLKNLTGKLATIEDALASKVTEELTLMIRTFNGLISNGSGLSRPGDALKVLRSKVVTLNDFARSRSYKNIEQTTFRMKEKLEKSRPGNVAGAIGPLKSDLTRMERLVSNSTLAENEKKALLTRMDSMKSEMELLGNLGRESQDIRAQVVKASLSLATWISSVEQLSEGMKGQRIQKQNTLVMLLAGLVGFLITAWLGIAYLFRWQSSRMAEQVEGEVRSVIQKGIIDDQRYMMDHFSENTRNDIVRLLDELKIKLSLGNLLHEGLPFAGCMVDTNFKLTWHNQLFLEQLYLSEEEVRSDAFNWDYVREYLNLNEDPIYEAMVNKIAGIYPVKVKQDELTPAQPYEMYVTPISANREDRVMVFFYPLISVKEAIAEQVNLSRSTIEKFIEFWNDDRLNDDEIRMQERNFKANDLADIYMHLSNVYERVNGEKEECLHSIASLERENEELNSRINDLIQSENEHLTRAREEIKVAGDLRTSFITSIERCESLLQINRSVMQQNDDVRNEAIRMQQMTTETVKVGRETVEILGQLDGIKTDYRKLKSELIEVKAKLISLNNSFFGQLPPLDENQQKLALRYKDELARLDFNVTTLDKKLSQLDIMIGKLSAMHERSVPQQGNFNFQTSQKDHELRETILGIQRSLSLEETKIVGHFKELHSFLKEDMKRVNASQTEQSGQMTN